MTEGSKLSPDILGTLSERAKELSCLYTVDEILQGGGTLEERLAEAASAIPSGWLEPVICRAVIEVNGRVHPGGCRAYGQVLSEPIEVQGNTVGSLSVFYPAEYPETDTGAFIPEERRLAVSLARRIADAVLYENLADVFSGRGTPSAAGSWGAVLRMLHMTDRKLYSTICRRLLNHIVHAGAESILEEWPAEQAESDFDPRRIDALLDSAAEMASPKIVTELLQRWMGENRIEAFIKLLEDHASSVSDIIRGMEAHRTVLESGTGMFRPVLNAVKVGLVRRLVSRRLEYIGSVRNLVEPGDFYRLCSRLVYPPQSHGQLGGKGAGLFRLELLLKQFGTEGGALDGVKTPERVYMTSDGISDFIRLNSLEEFLYDRYRHPDEIRLEYPNLLRLMEKCRLSTEMMNGLSAALDSLGDGPLAVRSSSLLEDSSGSSFRGRYATVFAANTGSRAERLQGLKSAVIRVYASMFGADAVQYRLQRNLLDFQEEMGVVIEKAVGQRHGSLFFPAFSGVACSIPGKGAMHRTVLSLLPGLGTGFSRGFACGYPVVHEGGAAGKTAEGGADAARLAPGSMDAIDLETGRVVTIPVSQMLKEFGDTVPLARRIFSRVEGSKLREADERTVYGRDYLVPVFQGLFSREGFMDRIQALLGLLETECSTPVEIEFACDGRFIHLLQWRKKDLPGLCPGESRQSIPQGEELLLKTSDWIPGCTGEGITHIIYLSADRYRRLQNRGDLHRVSHVLTRLNGILPKNRFAVVSPGLTLLQSGLNTFYSQFCNAAVLMEMALEGERGVSRLIQGTAFARDIEENRTTYMHFDPADSRSSFNAKFFRSSGSILTGLLPDAMDLDEILKVIHVPPLTGGRCMRLMHRGGTFYAVLAAEADSPGHFSSQDAADPGSHWKWRQRMAEAIARGICPEVYGVNGAYVFGSTKNATAGPRSDIDMLFHITGDPPRRRLLEAYLSGWDNSLVEMNRRLTGIDTESLLDVHLITDEDIQAKNSYAVKIGAVSDPARSLEMDGSF